MNKRLRKKLFRGEFAFLYFEISGKFKPHDSNGNCLELEQDERVDRFVHELIELIEANNMEMCGGFNRKTFSASIMKNKTGKRNPRTGLLKMTPCHCDEGDALLMDNWLKHQSIIELIEHEVSRLVPWTKG